MNSISIIGGGIGGLMTALCFDKLEIDYKLYERASELKEVGAGIWLSPNALQVIEWISTELLKEIQNTGNSLERILVADHNLKPICDSNQQFVKDTFGYTTIAIHRGKLQQILYSFASKEHIVLGKSFEHYSINDDDSYTVEFLDDTTIKTKALLGTDGINSSVRKQLFPNSELRYSGQTCWRGVADYEIDSELASVGFTLWDKKVQFGISKIAEGKTYWFAVKLSKPNKQDNRETLKFELLDMFLEFHPVVNKLIQNTTVDNIIRGDLKDLKPLSNWSKHNICLIGDAAHSMTPDLGQGGAQAIEDAYYLSNFIKSETGFERAFLKFYDCRKRKVLKLVKQSRNTSKIAITNRPLEIIRNFILKNTPQKFMEKQMLDLYTIDKSFRTKSKLSI